MSKNPSKLLREILGSVSVKEGPLTDRLFLLFIAGRGGLGVGFIKFMFQNLQEAFLQ